MATSPFLPLPVGIELETVTRIAAQVVVTLRTNAPTACCPGCTQPSARVHARYQRTVADLPAVGQPVRLILQVRKFVCPTRTCPRRIFTERLPDLVQPWARMTNRLRRAIVALGCASSGEATTRVTPTLGISTSPATVLRHIRATPLPAVGCVPHLGIDDFAFRRGRRYGTILVNLDTHRVLDLLPERTTDQAAAWLDQHPEITILSRDRGQDYAAAARQAAPQAQQVADRFHLLKNLTECVEMVLGRCWSTIRQAQHQYTPPLDAPDALPAGMDDWRLTQPTAAEMARHARRTAREDRYAQICALRHQGLSRVAIAKQLGMAQRTVERWVAEGVPHAAPRRKRANKLDAYVPIMLRRWEEGCYNGSQLWRELREQGYRGSERMVYRFLTTIRQRLAAEARAESAAPNGSSVHRQPPPGPLDQLVVRTAIWLVMRNPAQLDAAAQQSLQVLLARSATVSTLYDLVQRFRGMLHARQGDQLDGWLTAARGSAIKELATFVVGIERDKDAVVAGLSMEYSQGVVEGQVNRLKVIKRQMYGRAGFDLLRQRMLLPA
jgi:transposase